MKCRNCGAENRHTAKLCVHCGTPLLPPKPADVPVPGPSSLAGSLSHTYDVFISYARADDAWARGYLLDALDAADIAYHSEEAFALGVPRLTEFEQAIKASKRTLLILSPAYLADEFNQFTDLLAQTYGLETVTWPIIP